LKKNKKFVIFNACELVVLNIHKRGEIMEMNRILHKEKYWAKWSVSQPRYLVLYFVRFMIGGGKNSALTNKVEAFFC